MPSWAAGVFLLAFAARLAFVLVVDQPLLYTHQYTYFTNALRIVEHPEPVAYILRSDEWRTWDQHWTIAPLYHLFVALVFSVTGAHLLPLRVLQALLDALATVGVAALGRQAAGPRGAGAGVAYALYWPAVEMSSWTMTENLHTPLLVGGLALLAYEAARPRPAQGALAGVLLGLSALARSVSTGLLALAALWRLWRGRARPAAGPRLYWRPALALGLAGAAVILPWTARNVFLIGEPVLIETAAFENLWWANHLTDRTRYARQEEIIHSQATPAAKRAAAVHFALRGIRRSPERFVEKVGVNFRHFFRPEGLQNLLAIERSQQPWRHGGSLLLDDLPLVLAVPPFALFVLAGRASPARSLITLWLGYYLFMVVVVFHNEIRYRSAFVPFLFAGAAGGLAVLPGAVRTLRGLVGLALGLGLAVAMVGPYVGPAARALAAWHAVGPVCEAVAREDLAEAAIRAESSASRDPRSPRPWFTYGRALAAAGHAEPAIEAYRRGARLATDANWSARVALPALIRRAGRAAEADAALEDAHRLSWGADPWLALETAWRELPAPRASEVVIGDDDYGAVRGFLYPRGGDPKRSAHRLEWNRYDWMGGSQPPPGLHRWSRARAWIRLAPPVVGPAMVTIEMGSPFPSPLEAPEVAVAIGDARPVRVTLGREMRRYSFPADLRPGRPLVVRLDAPTWSRAGEPADQAVRVERVAVVPREPLRAGDHVESTASDR